MPAGSNPSFLTPRAGRSDARARTGSGPRDLSAVWFRSDPPRRFRFTRSGRVRHKPAVGHRRGLCDLRHCPACELDWLVSSGGRVQDRTLHELRNVMGRATSEDLADWLSDHCDVDVYLEDIPEDHDENAALTVRIGTSGVALEFPFSLPELVSTVDELLDDVLQEWEKDL